MIATNNKLQRNDSTASAGVPHIPQNISNISIMRSPTDGYLRESGMSSMNAWGGGDEVDNSQNIVPWFPYNFHAGNFFADDPNAPPGHQEYSSQNETTFEMLRAGMVPLPTWVFSPKFTLDQLRQWTTKQIALFKRAGRKLHQIRIKNPGQGIDWTADNVWAHVEVMLSCF